MSDVKAVVVRLNCDKSDPQWEKAYAAVIGDEETKKAALWDFIQIAKAIGTPVAGGELEVVCSIDEDILRDIRELDEDDEEYVTDMIFKPNPEGFDTVRLVRQSDAQADLAAAQAEITWLRDHLETVQSYLQEAPSVFSRRSALDVIEEALKGPAA